MKKAVCTGLAVIACALACGPIGPFAGGRLSGDVGAADARDWDFGAAVKVAQLETRPEDPHSVNTWFATIGTKLYVPTSMILGPKDPTERAWVAHVGVDPRVRIRIGDKVFERTAVQLEPNAEYDAARTALETKYELDPAERDSERTIWIFRLDPRAS